MNVSKTFVSEAGASDESGKKPYAKITVQLENIPAELLGEHGAVEHAVEISLDVMLTAIMGRCEMATNDRLSHAFVPMLTLHTPRQTRALPAWAGPRITEENVTSEQLDAERKELNAITGASAAGEDQPLVFHRVPVAQATAMTA